MEGQAAAVDPHVLQRQGGGAAAHRHQRGARRRLLLRRAGATTPRMKLAGSAVSHTLVQGLAVEVPHAHHDRRVIALRLCLAAVPCLAWQELVKAFQLDKGPEAIRAAAKRKD